MKAIVRETYGPPDVLHLEEVPQPTLGDRERAAADLRHRAAEPDRRRRHDRELRQR